MKYIFDVDGVVSTKYKYNMWTTVEFEDNTFAKDSRVVFGDNYEIFQKEVEAYLKEMERSEHSKVS